MNITTKSTRLMILRICKLIQDNVEADMNGTDDEIFYFLQKLSYFIMVRVVKITIIFLFQCIHKSYQICVINLFWIFSYHWVDLRQNYI